MAEFLTLSEAIKNLINNGDKVAMEGFTHLIPFAAGHEIIRQKKRDLTLIRLTPDLIYDQLIGSGCATKLIFSWGGNPGVGSLHRLRDAVENNWPHSLQIEEHSHAGLANAYVAGASNLPFAILRGYSGTDLPHYNSRIATVVCPFTGEKLAAVPAVNPDVSIIHAQQADKAGNVMFWGILGVQKEAILSAKRSLITVEEVVEKLVPRPGSVILPNWVVTAIAHVPEGSFPSYAQDYTVRNNGFYQEWDEISRSRESFTRWLEQEILTDTPAVTQ